MLRWKPIKKRSQKRNVGPISLSQAMKICLVVSFLQQNISRICVARSGARAWGVAPGS